MLRKIILFILLISINSQARILTNKQWFKKENLTNPIFLNINEKRLDLDKDIEEITAYYSQKPMDHYFLPKKVKINNMQKKCADDMKNNIYLLRPKIDKPVTLPADLSWKENPFNDRNWQFWFQSWKFTSCLLDGYRAFNDPWYLNRMKWLVSDWWKDNFKSDFPSKEFSWHDHTIPKRLHYMLEIFEFLHQNHALDENFVKITLRSIYLHARILAEEKSLYIKNHNHGLDQSMKLFEISQLLPEFTLAKSWEKIAKKRLKNEISFALTSEGIHKENSPGYHPWVSVYCAEINDFAKHYTGKTITEENSRQLQEDGLRFITFMTRPDLTLPQLGDTSPNRKLNIHYPLQKELHWDPYYQYVISKGKKGKEPREGTGIFKESGYFIYRDKWDTEAVDEALHLVFKCGFLARGHRHNDDGNVLLYAFGEDWLIDGGTYGYEYNRYRTYVESPSAHNVSLPYDTRMSPPSDKEKITQLDDRFGKYNNNWGITDVNQTHATCETHMFKGYTYTRILNISDEYSFSLDDKLSSDDNDSNKTFMTLFKVPDDKEIYINTDKKNLLILSTKKDIALKIHYVNNFSEIKLFRGDKSDIFSLETISWLKMHPAKTIAFINNANNIYSTHFELKLIHSPRIKGYKKLLTIDNNTKITIQDQKNNIIFNVSINLMKKDFQIAFYLYKDNKRIDTQWYGTKFTYSLNKQKYGKGIYKIKYFIVDGNSSTPGNSKKFEIGYSKEIQIP